MSDKYPNLKAETLLKYLRGNEAWPAPEELDLQAYRDMLRAGRRRTHYSGADPEVPPPSMFQPDVPVAASDPELAKMVYRLLNLDPVVKQRVSRVNFGQTRDTIPDLMRIGGDPTDDWRDVLEGMYGDISGSHEIAIDPRKTPSRDLLETIAHEILHAGGYGEAGAREGEKTLYPEKPVPWKDIDLPAARKRR